MDKHYDLLMQCCEKTKINYLLNRIGIYKNRSKRRITFRPIYLAEAVGFEPTSPKRTTAFRVRPVMTTSIRFHMTTV